MVRLKGCAAALGIPLVSRFQFHNGSIKSHRFADLRGKLHQFQFHNGSIKRLPPRIWLERLTMFQFHNGSIKSRKPDPPNICIRCFNSTMVRLKVNVHHNFELYSGCFNSTMVRLKARPINKKYYTKPALCLQGKNYPFYQKSSTSGYAKLTGG